MIWYKIEEQKPIAYQTGNWDGKKSDKILACTIGGQYHIVEMYEGILGGSEFCDFYDGNDFEIQNVKFWTEIYSPY